MTSPRPPEKQRSLFRVTFQGGAAVTTIAATSLLAEREAIRTRPGIIKSVKRLRAASPSEIAR